MNDLTADRLRGLVLYDAATGLFTWRGGPRGVRAGGSAGTSTRTGYVAITIDGKHHQAHRLAWLYAHGQWPTAEIDHINGVRSDNRLCNLRDVPVRDNRCNAARRNDNGSGVAGVHWDAARQKWQAKISLNKRLIFLGRFTSYDAAVVARRSAERAYGYSERHGTSPA